MWFVVFGFLMFVTSVFLILLVLVQRGRGGGLAGAFGGMGGQSAFGTKAGDLFTRVTMVVAAFWIILCVAAIAVLNSQRSRFGEATGDSAFGSAITDTSEDTESDGGSTSPLTGEGGGPASSPGSSEGGGGGSSPSESSAPANDASP